MLLRAITKGTNILFPLIRFAFIFSAYTTHTSSFSLFFSGIFCIFFSLVTQFWKLKFQPFHQKSYCVLGCCMYSCDWFHLIYITPFVQERPPTSSMMLSSKKSDAGSSSSSSSSSAGAAGGDRAPVSDAQTGPSASAAGPMDAKKKERSSPSGEPGGAPMPHQAGPGGVDQDSAEVRRTSRRKRAKVNILGFSSLPVYSGRGGCCQKYWVMNVTLFYDHLFDLRINMCHLNIWCNIVLYLSFTDGFSLAHRKLPKENN